MVRELRTSTRWNVRGWPTIYVFDEKGVIRYRDVRGPELDKALESLLGEMGEPVSIKHDDEAEDDQAAPSAEKKDATKPAEPKTDSKGAAEPAKSGRNE